MCMTTQLEPIQPVAYSFTEAEASNLVVRQKNDILGMINAGRFVEARALVSVLAEMWARLDYAYKTREITARIEQAETIANRKNACENCKGSGCWACDW